VPSWKIPARRANHAVTVRVGTVQAAIGPAVIAATVAVRAVIVVDVMAAVTVDAVPAAKAAIAPRAKKAETRIICRHF
jgi:hypothetical protein